MPSCVLTDPPTPALARRSIPHPQQLQFSYSVRTTFPCPVHAHTLQLPTSTNMVLCHVCCTVLQHCLVCPLWECSLSYHTRLSIRLEVDVICTAGRTQLKHTHWVHTTRTHTITNIPSSLPLAWTTGSPAPWRALVGLDSHVYNRHGKNVNPLLLSHPPTLLETPMMLKGPPMQPPTV